MDLTVRELEWAVVGGSGQVLVAARLNAQSNEPSGYMKFSEFLG
jgi:hypothetical protein